MYVNLYCRLQSLLLVTEHMWPTSKVCLEEEILWHTEQTKSKSSQIIIALRFQTLSGLYAPNFQTWLDYVKSQRDLPWRISGMISIKQKGTNFRCKMISNLPWITSDPEASCKISSWGSLWCGPGTWRWSWTDAHHACPQGYPRHRPWRKPVNKLEPEAIQFWKYSYVDEWGQI